MKVYFGYAMRETGVNLWRNRLMTIAAVLTVSVSLALVGWALLVKQSAAQASLNWEQQTRVTVWMKPAATVGEHASVASELASSPYVHGSCIYLNKKENYQAAKHLLDPAQFNNLTVQEMPTSYVCQPATPTVVSEIISSFSGQPGVMEVTAPSQQIKAMEKTIRIVQYILFGLALILLVSAVVLILNTIRLAIFARRREVNVMKLVGATNWFIRIPFISEGFIQGLFGSLIACLFVTLLWVWYPLTPRYYQLSGSDVLATNIVVVLAGVCIGSLGSAFAIRRFLDA
jgi:cell division transport system permease protein